MVWLAVFGAIALVGLAGLGWYGWRLWRKAAILMREVRTVGDQLGQAADLLDQLRVSPPSAASRTFGAAPAADPGATSPRVRFAPDPWADDEDEDELGRKAT